MQVVSLSQVDLVVLEGQNSKMTSVMPWKGRTILGRGRKSGDNRLGSNQSAADDSHRVIIGLINGNNIRQE